MKKNIIGLMILAMLGTAPAFAMNYNELSVYGYQTASEHETEVENSSSWSSADNKSLGSEHVFRTSLEVTQGLTDKWEVAGYADFTRNPDETLKLTGYRARTRTHFFEKGEMAIDSGLYFEVELPKDSEESYALETKLIFEKDFGRFTFVLNPTLEYVQLKEANEEGEISEIEKKYSAKVSYNLSSRVQPHVDVLGELGDEPKQLLLAAADFGIMKGFKGSVGAGFGLTESTEKQLVSTRFEYEF